MNEKSCQAIFYLFLNAEGGSSYLYGSITFFGCLVMLRAFSRKSVVSFKANTKTVEYSVEYFFRKKFGTLSLDEIEKITEIETPGFGSDPKGYRLALVTTAGIIIPLSYTHDNITDNTKLITDVTQANQKSITYGAKNNRKLLIVSRRCVTSVIT